jgi:hypothetical protein
MIVEVEHLVWAAVSAVAYESHECEDVRPGSMLISVKSNTTSSMAGNEGGQKGEHTTCYPRDFGEVTVGLDRTKTIMFASVSIHRIYGRCIYCLEWIMNCIHICHDPCMFEAWVRVCMARLAAKKSRELRSWI